jgi:hypothetical protein
MNLDPGLVRITQSDGIAVRLAGLVSRGTKLRNDHPAKDWFALVEPAAVPVPRTSLTIEAFSGLDTELTRATVDLSGKSSAQVDVHSSRSSTSPAKAGSAATHTCT